MGQTKSKGRILVSDPANDFLAVGPSRRILQLNVGGLRRKVNPSLDHNSADDVATERLKTHGS